MNLLENIDQLNTYFREERSKDDLYIFNGFSWANYQKLLDEVGDEYHFKISYIRGVLEVMSPGRSHEKIKENIANLIVAYCDAKEIDYYNIGSTTLKKSNVGKEPDVSYAIASDKEFPDLAIEVNYSSGGINDLEIYRILGIKEVWIWNKDDNLSFYILQNQEYIKRENSYFLPDLTTKLVGKYIKLMNTGNTRVIKKEFLNSL